jgi:hypothetical protein
VGAFLEAHHDLSHGDHDVGNRVDEVITEDVLAVAEFLAKEAGQADRLLAINVSCRSQPTCMATAENSASIWKKSAPSAMPFSMSMRCA